MLLQLALLLLAKGALGLRASLDSAEEFDRAVFAPGVSSFLKFYAPWCGHCKALAPAWDQLGLEYAASPSVLIGEVDCTSSGGKVLCEHFGVEGYPTLKFNQAGDSEVQDANLPGNSLDELKEFAATKVRAGCSQVNQNACSPQELATLTSFAAMSAAEREAKLAELDAPLAAARAVVDKLHEELEELEEKVEEAEEALEKGALPRCPARQGLTQAREYRCMRREGEFGWLAAPEDGECSAVVGGLICASLGCAASADASPKMLLLKRVMNPTKPPSAHAKEEI